MYRLTFKSTFKERGFFLLEWLGRDMLPDINSTQPVFIIDHYGSRVTRQNIDNEEKDSHKNDVNIENILFRLLVLKILSELCMIRILIRKCFLYEKCADK